MAVVYVLMYFKCKICFTVYTGETKINDTYLLTYLLDQGCRCHTIKTNSKTAIIINFWEGSFAWDFLTVINESQTDLPGKAIRPKPLETGPDQYF